MCLWTKIYNIKIVLTLIYAKMGVENESIQMQSQKLVVQEISSDKLA